MTNLLFGKAINGMAVHFVKENAPETDGFSFAKCDPKLQIRIDKNLTMLDLTCASCRRYKVYRDFITGKGLDEDEEQFDNPIPDDNNNSEVVEEEEEEFDTDVDIEDYFHWLDQTTNNEQLKAFCEKNLINIDLGKNFYRNKRTVKETVINKYRSGDCILSSSLIDSSTSNKSEGKSLKEYDGPVYEYENHLQELRSLFTNVQDWVMTKEKTITSVLESVSEIVGSINDRIEKLEKAVRSIPQETPAPVFTEVPSYKDELKEARKSKKRIMTDEEDHFELVTFGEKINVHHIPSGQYLFSNIEKAAAKTVVKYLNNLRIKWGNTHETAPKDFVKATVVAFRAAYASHQIPIKIAPNGPEEKPESISKKRVLKRRRSESLYGDKALEKNPEAKPKRALKRRSKK